jgi:DNA mismatch repair ATPase MutS
LLYYLDNNNLFPLLIGISLNWNIIGSFYKYIKKQHELLSKKQEILDQYAAILQEAATMETGSSTILMQLKTEAFNASKAIKKLSVLSRLFDQRANLLVILFINSLGLYDIQCMWALEAWKKRYRSNFNDWINCVGNIESVNSLATFAFNNPGYTYPVVKESTAFINAKGLSHPLIPDKECVANDFELGGNNKLVLVTGSNMSGKTTFLRTLGVNLLLAQCGTPVNAIEFSFSPMLVATSIRVSDSLQEHTSYFMAELIRLQQIIRQLQQNKTPTLVLIDEILRGTNSDDKTHGSDQFIRKLLQYNCLTLFATHDLTLSKLENEFPRTISNYCFESTIENGELLFDYTLRKGVAKNKNASFLMKKMDII